MRQTLAKLVWGLVSGLVLGAGAAVGQTPAETAAYQATLAEQMDAFVHERVASFFKDVELPTPVDVEVETAGAFRPSTKTAGQGEVAELNLTVVLKTDQPSAVVREARQHLARGLVDQGYRLASAGGAVASAAESQGDARPVAILTVRAEEPLASQLDAKDVRVYATFTALILAFVASLGLLFYMLLWPLRRRRRRLAPIRQEPAIDPGPQLPEIPVAFAPLSRPETVAAVPTVSTVPATSAVPVATRAVDAAVAAPLPTKVAAPNAGQAPVLDPETLALRQMPFEKVLDLLIAASPSKRKDMIDRLDLNPPLKRRLEKELLAADGGGPEPLLEPT